VSRFDLEQVRARYARLLSGDFRPEDAAKLFEYLRFKNDERVAVKEVGDLIAHEGEKDRGLFVQTAQSMCDVHVNYFYCALQKDARVPLRMPLRFKEGLRYALAVLKDDNPRHLFGFTESEAQHFLETTLLKFRLINGALKLTSSLSPTEDEFLFRLQHTVGNEAAFSAEELTADLNHLIRKKDISDKQLMGDPQLFVTLFVLSKMHNTLLKLKSFPKGILTLNQSWGKLYCALKLAIPHWDETTGEGPTFPGGEIVLHHMTTNLPANKFCKDEYLDYPRTPGFGGGLPLEATSDLRLEPIGPIPETL
jgi:hypothetical protein